MGSIKRFEDLEIWKKASEIAVDVFEISGLTRFEKDFGTKDQVRRAALSIASNIAEGFEYDNNKDFIRFLKYAKGSAGELRSQLYTLFRAEFIEESFYKEKHEELLILSKRIATFIKYLKSR
ncbi:four helix bundle protein [Fulvivirgaceae bacterium BMA10]|uniref:Four helix bundle protein n=1 Tax=Splendidivirga corallicola TaxID=3051826 RepID=A0ABT8KHB5_9BACT|nr:four helix bundle protein [Fulvivirgaceae bacterium BMA10]